MKSHTRLILLLFISASLNVLAQQIPSNPNISDANGRQGTWTIYFDKDWEIIDTEKEALYYRIITYKDDKPIGPVRDYYRSGKIQMDAHLLIDRPQSQFDGLVIFFEENGSIQAVEFYKGNRTDQESLAILNQYDTANTNIQIVHLKAAFYHALRSKKAQPFYVKWVQMVKKKVGEKHIAYANAMREFAWDYIRHGDYINAEPLLFQAKDIIYEHRSENMMLYAQVLSDMGDYYRYASQPDKGLKYLNEAMAFAKEFTKEDDYFRFNVMNNLALCYRDLGDNEKAIEYYLIVIEGSKKIFGKFHREVANTLNNLTISYQQKGDLQKAKQTSNESLEIYKVLYGENHLEYMDALYRMGQIHMQLLELEEGSKIYTKLYPKYLEMYGEQHPKTSQVERSYGFALYRLGKKEEAIAILRNNFQNHQDYIHHYFDYMNEDAREALYRQLIFIDSFQFSLASKETQYTELHTDLLNFLLRNKAILISTTNNIKKRILESNDRKLIELYNKAQEIRQQLSLYRDMSNDEVIKEYKINRDSLNEVLQNMDRDLNRLSTVYATSNTPPNWQLIKDKLGKDEALVEIHRYQEFDFQNWKWSNIIRYVAFVVTAKTKEPVLIKLADGNYLEEKGIKAYANKIKFKLQDDESYNNFWKPIELELRKYKKIYFSSDGVYHNVNLQTLINPSTKKYLIQEKDIQIITSGRDLIETPRKPSPAKLGMLIGNPSFGEFPEGFNGTKRSIELLTKGNERSGIAPLPGSEKEVNTIAGLLNNSGWKSIVLTNDEAEEGALKDMLKPNILHIATHAFFYQQNNQSNTNPLYNTGLLFTGAAKAFASPETNSKNNDGILTSYEALNLNIDNTNLVVLSACETGLGDILNGEGIYGLQRAFKIAGARTIIMSLWKVDDLATNELMTAFYDFLLNGGLSKREAFFKAQLKLKEKYPEPYYWGAFVVLGE